MDRQLEKLIAAWKTAPAIQNPGTDLFGDSVALHRIRRALKLRALRLRGVDARRLRRWKRRYDRGCVDRRNFAKAICFGIGYGRGPVAPVTCSSNSRKENCNGHRSR